MNQLVFITDEEKLRRIIREELQVKNDLKKDHELSDRMDRRSAAKFMGVSYQTMHNWTKAGIIKQHGTGRKKFYLRHELVEILKNS